MPTQPDWIVVTFIGAAVGYLLPHAISLAVYMARRLQRAPIEGVWHVYNITNRGGIHLVQHNTWQIGKGYNSRFVVKSYYEEFDKAPLYEGTVSFERNFWLVDLKAKKHDEKVSIRFHSPIATQDDYTTGIYLAIDFQGTPTAGPALISRTQLTSDEAMALLLAKIKVHQKMKLLTM